MGEGGEAFVELEGGCVCCQLSDELRDTLQMLRERVQPDRVIVETSGVALPSDTQLQFWREPVSAWVDDDVTVVVVNAEQLVEGRDLHGTFEDQVSSADLLLLNKIDLAPAADLDRLDALLHDMAPDTPVLHTCHGEVEPALLFPPDPDGLRRQRRNAGKSRPPTITRSSRPVKLPLRTVSTQKSFWPDCGVSECCGPRDSCTPPRGCNYCRESVAALNWLSLRARRRSGWSVAWWSSAGRGKRGRNHRVDKLLAGHYGTAATATRLRLLTKFHS